MKLNRVRTNNLSGETQIQSLSKIKRPASNIPGVIYMEGAQFCSIEGCKIRHIGWYGIELAEGCQFNRIIGNEISDMGAGGIKINGSDHESLPNKLTGNNTFTDNHIYNGGHVFYSAVGIASLNSFNNNISHNHIHDLYYTGISCGWVWGYKKNISVNNRICKNHIHDLGKGLLSDMGGIYTLGIQPGTIISGNLIHDITKSNYGGWGIYADEGSSHIVIEKNICYNTSSQGFYQHFGKENIIRNNIFVFGGEGQVSNSNAEDHNQFTFEKNIVISDNAPFFAGGYACKLEQCSFKSDLNLFWDISGNIIMGVNSMKGYKSQGVEGAGRVFDVDEWKKLGYDRHSIIKNPLFKDLDKYDFTLAEESPAFELGFEEIDMSDVGPRDTLVSLFT